MKETKKSSEGFQNDNATTDVSTDVETDEVTDKIPEATETPEDTETPEATKSPEATESPEATMITEAPEVSADIVNQVASEPAMVDSTPTLPPVASLKTVSGSNLLGTNASVYQFEPSDLATSSGASLDNAFDKPLPRDVNTDTVDINRNNVVSYNSKDFLPKEINDDWFNTDFSQAKYKMNDDKLINTDKYIVGINTVGQSLKNASYDIRGAINVPKYTISPFLNSTIEPDYNIKPLC